MPVDANALSCFLLGLLGTGHCLGMCGPLVFALPGSQKSIWGHVAYHAGRLLTYIAIGAALAGIGGGVVRLGGLSEDAALQWTTRIQIGLSFVAAVFLMLFGLTRLGLLKEPRWMAIVNPNRVPGYGPALRRVLHHGNILWLFIIGLLLGLLPCGLSFAAFARALATQQITAGARIMVFFGIGTLPGLLLLGTGVGAFLGRFRVQMEILAGLIMIAMAVSLVADMLPILI